MAEPLNIQETEDVVGFAETAATSEESAADVGLLGTLGINGNLFLAQLLNFAVVFFVMWRWVYRPLVKVMDERSANIERGLKDAAEAAAARQAAESEKAQVLADAKRDALKMIADAEAAGKVERDAAVLRAKAEIEKMVGQGKELLAQEKTRMAQELQSELGELVALAVAHVVREKVDSKRDKQLIADALADAQKKV